MGNRKAAILFTLFLVLHYSLSGQKLINSPFSRYNLGSLEPAASFRSLGMGGTGTAFRDNTSIYFSNPASYSSLDTNSFVFDFGIDFAKNGLKEGDATYSSADLNFDHLIIAMPLDKGWGLALGVVNISNGYYRIDESVAPGVDGYNLVTGAYSSIHEGDGGFTSFFLGTGINLTKNISAGINLTMLLGNVSRINQTEFEDYYNVFHHKTSEKLQLSGANLEFGVQYRTSLGTDYFFNAGASLSSGKDYRSDFNKISYRYTAYGTTDTLSYTSDNQTKAYIPGTLRLGISTGKKDLFTFGFDYVRTNWAEAKIHGSAGFLGNTQEYRFGIEYIPEKLSNYDFLKRLEYRAGFHLGDNYLVLDNQQIKEKGFSLGIGIPMRREFSRTNIFFDYSKKSSAMLHNETFITLGASLNFYDFWFIKRRYD